MKKYLDKDGLQDYTQKITQKYKTMFGSPLVANTAAEMTDTNKVYVYVGSESGYTNGNWYYYDGTNWKSGGIYNAVAVETDDTLSVAGKAADAKATGDAIKNIKIEVDPTLTTEGKAADAKAVGDALNKIVFTEFSKNLYPGVYALRGGFINTDTGEINKSSSYTPTGYIDVSKQSGSIVFSCNYTFATSAVRYAFYDKDKNFISGSGGIISSSSIQNDTTLKRYYVIMTVPTNAAFMRFSAINTWMENSVTPQYERMIEYGNAPTEYEAYFTPREGLKTQLLTENPEFKIISSITEGVTPAQVKNETLTDGQRMVIESNSIMKNQNIVFFAKIGTLSTVYVGHGKSTYGFYIGVTATSLQYIMNGTVGTTIAHGLEIKDFILINLSIDQTLNVRVTITTAGGSYEKTSPINLSTRGEVFAESAGSSLADCVLTWNCDDYKKPVWAFGDSYFTLYSATRWPNYIVKQWGYDTMLLNAYPGETAAGGYNDLINALKHGTPKYILWCLGMNNPDTASAINVDWLLTIKDLRQICEDKNITLVLATIPETTSAATNNAKKNQYIIESGLPYVDFAKAVLNVDGWESSDGVHPSEIGGKILAAAVMSDFPQILQS